MSKYCDTGIKTAVESAVGNRPWLSYTKDSDYIQVILPPPNIKSRITSRTQLPGIAKALADHLNKSINSSVAVGQVFYVEVSQSGNVYVSIKPTRAQLGILNQVEYEKLAMDAEEQIKEEGAAEKAAKEREMGIEDGFFYAAGDVEDGEEVQQPTDGSEVFFRLFQDTEEESAEEDSEDFMSQEDPKAPERKGLAHLVLLKEKLLSTAYKRLSAINAALPKLRGDEVAYEEAIREKNTLQEYIYGNEEKGEPGLREEINELKKQTVKSAHIIAPYIEKEIGRLEKLIQSKHPEDLAEARNIIQFINAMNNFRLEDAENHPIFSKEDMFHEGRFLLSEGMIKSFADWADRVRLMENQLRHQEEKALEDVYNNNTMIQKMYDGKKFTYAEITGAGKGLADATWIDMMIMDITSGIFSHNGTLPQLARKVLEDAMRESLSYSENLTARMDDIMEDVVKEVEKLEGGKYKLGIIGLNGISFDWMRQVTKKGEFLSNICDKFSHEWFQIKGSMESKFRSDMKKAVEWLDINDVISETRKAVAKRNKWLRENSETIDPARLSAVTGHPDFQDLSDGKFNYTQGEIEEYEKYVKSIVGEKYFERIVESQLQKFQEYKVQKSQYIKQVMEDAGVNSTAALNTFEIARIKVWEAENNPFLTAEHIRTDAPARVGFETEYFPKLRYNIQIPLRNNRETGADFGYYDSKYEAIEDNDVLMKFYDIAKEATTMIREQYSPEDKRLNLDTTVPFQKKTFAEYLLNTPDITLLQILSESYRRFIDWFKTVIGVRIQDQMSYAKVNPVTGVPEYTVNDSFLKNNINKIQDAFNLSAMEFLQDYISLTQRRIPKITRGTHINLTRMNTDAMVSLLDRYIPGLTKDSLLEQYPDKRVPVGKIIWAYTQHQIAKEQSFDLPMILKLHTKMAAEYSARQQVLPFMELIKRHYEQIRNVATQNTGDEIYNSALYGKTRYDGFRTHANKQFDNWFRRVVLGEKDLRKQYGFLKRDVETPDKDAEDRLSRTIGYITKGRKWDGKLFTEEEKKIKQRLDRLMEDPNLSQDDLEEVRKMSKRLGADMSVSGIVDMLLNFIRFKGMAYNVSSGITNVVEGQIANAAIAASGMWFPSEYIDTVTLSDLMYSDSMKRLGKGRGLARAILAQRMMENWDVLQDSKNELQKASVKSGISGVSKLAPFFIQSKTETYNQIPLMVAILRDTEIEDNNGVKGNVWDAMELTEHGFKLKDEYRGVQKNIDNWEDNTGQEYLDFRTKLSAVIKDTHGDYDQLSGMMAKSTHLGTLLMMFKTWLPREFYKRFAVKQDNILTGTKGFKGRYRSLTPGAGAMIGGGALAFTIGPAGLLVGGIAGAAFSKMYSDATSPMDFLEEMIFMNKMLFRKMAGMPVNLAGRILGKGKIIETDSGKVAGDRLQITGEFTRQDMANWKANIQDMAVMYALLALMLMTKMLAWDDDDDKDSARRKAHNFFINRFTQISSSLVQYLNLYEMHRTITDMSIIRLFSDCLKLGKNFEEFMEGKDVILTGEHAGEHKVVNQALKTFLPPLIANPLSFGFETQMERQFVPLPIDKWAWSDEHKAKYEISQIRAKLRGQLKESIEDPDEINKIVSQKIPAKKKGESYQDMLKRVKSSDALK